MVRMVAGRLFHMSGPATEKATPSELRPASFDGSDPSSGGAKLAYIRVGRSKHDKVR